MTRTTVNGREVFLKRTKHSWIVLWGRTAISKHRTWQSALAEIIELFNGGEA